MLRPKYLIYPSVLTKFYDYINIDVAMDSFWNKDGEGDYKLSYEEMSDKLEKDLLDTINRVQGEPSEAASRGTCFNEIVDCLVLNVRSTREDVTLESFLDPDYGILVNAKTDGFDFNFMSTICREVAQDFSGSIPQYRCKATLETSRGLVGLYGDVDYIAREHIFDLKTTSKYAFGKYETGFQKDLYPYCLIESGDVTSVQDFTYYVVEWIKRVDQPLTGNVYKEVYTYSHSAAKSRLLDICERFIDYLEVNRDKITNKKIFNESDSGDGSPVLLF